MSRVSEVLRMRVWVLDRDAWLLAGGVVMVLGSAPGCTKDRTLEKTGAELGMLASEVNDAGNVVERFDLNGDRKADVWKVFKEIAPPDKPKERRRLLIRKDVDLNYDAKVDVREFYDEATGELGRVEMDFDFDGKIDAVDVYKDGRRVRREVDFSFDGRADLVKHYDDEGKLATKERDTDRDGKVDTWEYFEDGKLVRVGRDRDGDGKPEYFDDAPDAEPELPAAPAPPAAPPVAPPPPPAGDGKTS